MTVNTVNVVEAKSKTMIYNWKRGNNADPIINVIPPLPRSQSPRLRFILFLPSESRNPLLIRPARLLIFLDVLVLLRQLIHPDLGRHLSSSDVPVDLPFRPSPVNDDYIRGR